MTKTTTWLWLHVAVLLFGVSIILFNISIHIFLHYSDFWLKYMLQVALITVFLSFASIIAIFNRTWARLHLRILRYIFFVS